MPSLEVQLKEESYCSIPCHQSLEKENTRLHVENLDLKSQNQELLDKLLKNSQNSSKPPSSDGYEKPKPKSLRTKTGKSPGGQIGHEGHRLELVDNPDEIEVHGVDVCEKCGRDLSDIEVKKHECRQEFDIPPVEPIVTEHRRESKLCPDCGFMNTGEFPSHITQLTQYGARVKATATYFNQYQFIPFNRLSELFKDCYNLSMSEGSFVNFNTSCSVSIEPSLEAIKAHIISNKVVGLDESGMRLHGKLHWLHVARTQSETYYTIHKKRGQEAMDLMGILTHYTGTAVHDHWKPYYSYENCKHSLCNAHHLRELKFVETRYQQSWAPKLTVFLLEINRDVQAHKKRGCQVLDTQLCQRYSQKYSRILREGKKELALLPIPTQSKYGKKKQHKAKNLWDRLRNNKADTLRFMNDFNVPFTNNASEGDIRMCKVKGKISGSFRSENGANSFCRIRSYISTARKRSMNVMDALSDAFTGTPYIPEPLNTS